MANSIGIATIHGMSWVEDGEGLLSNRETRITA